MLYEVITLTGGSAAVAAPANWVSVNSVPELEERLRAAGRPVMLDFYADWCVSCKEMERFTFSDSRVRAQMDRMLLLRADVTDGTEQHKLLLKRFSLFGPPGIIFFDAQGREIKGLVITSYSIHYTKLYDSDSVSRACGHRVASA